MDGLESRPNSKVARVIDEYGLDGLGAEMERKWTGQSGDRTSLRDLASEFNIEVLRSALADAGGDAIGTDVAGTYRALADDATPSGERIRTRRELERIGIDVEDLERDFVTHQAIHTYLTDYRNAELPDRSENIVERKVETIERLQGRTIAVAESTVDMLINADRIAPGEYELFVDVRAVCTECGVDAPLVDLLRDGGCDCDQIDS